MAVPRVLRLLTFGKSILAFAIRNDPQLNPTVEVTTVGVPPASLVITTWRPKVHGESSADGWDPTTAGNDSRVRTEATASDFDVTVPTTTERRGPKDSAKIIDIGTVIQSLITSTALAVPTVHFENSASGWEDATSTVHYESTATDWGAISSGAAHWESSATGWGQTGNEDLLPQSTRYKTVEVSDNSWTKNLRPSQTIAPAGSQITDASSKMITEFSPPPAITHNGVTVRPVAVTRKPTVTLPNGVVTTTEKVEFRVAIGSSTLSIGKPITINDIAFGVTTDAAGSTILHAGDSTITLPRPTAGEVRTLAGDVPERLSIVTAVISGTTKYVLAGQTLAPGQPVIIGGTPISIIASGDETVLYVGDRTTTLPAASDIQTLTDWVSISTSTQGTIANTEPASAIPTSNRSGSYEARKLDAAFIYCFVGAIMLVFNS